MRLYQSKTLCNKSELLKKVMDDFRNTLTHCKYPKWAIDRVERRLLELTTREATVPIHRTLLALITPLMKSKPRVTLSYLTPRVYAKASKRFVVSMVFRSTSRATAPLKTSWFLPRIRTSWKTKVYWFQCGDLACDEEYIGETSRTFGERFKEHLKEPSPIHNHSCTVDHTASQDNFQIIGREDHGTARTIKEPFYVRINNPTLNRNVGKFNLHHIWDRVLLNTLGLK